MSKTLWTRGGLAIALALTLTACGGDGDDSPTGPSTPVTGPPGTTINITSSGVSPQTLTVPAGTRVTFTNNDGRPHEMTSNPHPEHTDCVEMNQVGHLESGQARESGNLNTRRTCQFHDHINPNSSQFFGSIIIQ